MAAIATLSSSGTKTPDFSMAASSRGGVAPKLYSVYYAANGPQAHTTAVESVVAKYVLPAGTLLVPSQPSREDRAIPTGPRIFFRYRVTHAANVNAVVASIYAGASAAEIGSAVVGGTAIFASGNLATSGGITLIEGDVYKYGAPGSNTQHAVRGLQVTGTATVAFAAPTALTLKEDEDITFALTFNAATAATDLTLNFFEVYAFA